MLNHDKVIVSVAYYGKQCYGMPGYNVKLPELIIFHCVGQTAAVVLRNCIDHRQCAFDLDCNNNILPSISKASRIHYLTLCR